MEFIRGIDTIRVNNEFDITTSQDFKEDETKVVITCAEFVPQFVKGFVCDLRCEFALVKDDYSTQEPYIENINDLVLVYINKSCDMDSMPRFNYVFYK